MPKKFTSKDDAEVHDDLKGFNINIDNFGQMNTSLSVDKLNTFLNKLKQQKEEEE